MIISILGSRTEVDRVNITDLTGKSVYEIQHPEILGSTTIKVQTAQLEEGSYVARIQTKYGMVLKMFVRQQ